MPWQVLLDPGALRELDDLDRPARERIWRFLYSRLAQLDDPRSVGQALRGTELGDLWKYRVGDYRIFARIMDQMVQVVVVEIGHRREVYR
jgi:mRNA interferase RelE/StbE